MTMILDGTAGATFPTWTTGTRPASPAVGQVGWNTTIGSLENYNGSAWTAVGGGGAGQWQAVQTSGFTAVSGNAYACNTTSAAFTVTLPASPAVGNYVQLVDYAGTWGTNNVTVSPNGLKIQSSTSNVTLSTNRQAVALVYIDSTQGWIVYSQGNAVGAYSIDYLVVAGGGAGADTDAAGGGAGGYLAGTTNVTATTTYAITIGAGAPATSIDWTKGANGSNSVLTGITTAIGGGGGGTGSVPASPADGYGQSGGSGGGAGSSWPSGRNGAGTVGQGNAGGNGVATTGSGGGGGAGAAGANAVGVQSGNGGVGLNWQSLGTYYAGGGGGGHGGVGATDATGGLGGGGRGTVTGAGFNGTVNTGGGGGGGGGGNGNGGGGGSGIVIIRYLSATQKGTGGTVTSSGGYYYHTFTSSGTYTA